MLDDRLRSLHREHAAFVLRLLSWSCGVPGCDVEDVAQLVWLQVHKLGPPPEAPKAWITTLAKNVAANERRKAGRRRDEPSAGVPVELVAPGLTAEERLSLRAYLTMLLEAVPNPDYREALFLNAEGLSAEEIGRVQDITPACARQRVHLAREQIRQAVAAGGDGGRGAKKKARCLLFLAVGFEDFIKPLAPEELDRQWNDIESAIRRHDGPARDGRPPSLPPPVVVPSVPPPGPVPPGLLPVAASKLVSPLVGALLGGAVAGVFLAPAAAPCRDPSTGLPSAAPAAIDTHARQNDARAPAPRPSALAPCREPSTLASAKPGSVATRRQSGEAASPTARTPAPSVKQPPIQQDAAALAEQEDFDRRARMQAERWAALSEEDDLDRRARAQAERWAAPISP